MLLIAKKFNESKKYKIFLFFIFLLFISSLIFLNLEPKSINAYGADVSSATADVENAKNTLNQIEQEYNSAKEATDNIESQLSSATNQAYESQNEIIKEQEKLSSIAKAKYVNNAQLEFVLLLFNSTSFDELVKNIDYANTLMQYHVDMSNAQKQRKANFESQINELQNLNKSYQASLSSLKDKQNQAQSLLKEAQDKLDAAQIAKSQEIAQNPIAPSVPEGGEWRGGEASAYGGSSDPGSGSRTASGDAITDSSMGVAIPMSWQNYRGYFGRNIIIRYRSNTVIAKINDCGSFGGGRALDLQPGVFKAFGASTCSEWGARYVEYQIL